MPTPPDPLSNWMEELVHFLREQPEVRAVRLDPVAHKLAIATIDRVDLADLEAKLASTIAGVLAMHFLPALPWLTRGLFLVGLVTGGWDAAVDTWANLKKREIDIHFLMLAVAVGAMFIGAWGEAVLLLFLFSASGAMEEYALDRTQREVSSLLKSAPKQAIVIGADGAELELPVEALQIGQRVR